MTIPVIIIIQSINVTLSLKKNVWKESLFNNIRAFTINFYY